MSGLREMQEQREAIDILDHVRLSFLVINKLHQACSFCDIE
ncbi:unnamed protein product, partial [Rotaria sp. Silwood1]